MASGDSLSNLHPHTAELPSSNFPQFNFRNAHPTLDFDASTAETANFTFLLPANYGGGGLTVLIRWAGATATSGNCKWNVAIERMDVGTLNTNSDSFASAQTTTTAANGTSGILSETSVAFTSGAQMDSIAAGETGRLQVKRDAADVGDTMTGDAQIMAVIVKET